MAGKAQINIEVGIQQAQSAIADLEAQIAGFKAQMDSISGAMFQTPDQRTGAFAGMSYDQLTEQFGQAQQQYLAAQGQLEAIQSQQTQVVEASATAQAEAVQKANDGILELRNGMTALGAVSRKSLDAEPVVVYTNSVRKAAQQTEQASNQMAQSFQRMGNATREVNVQQGLSINIVEGLRTRYQALAQDAEKLQALPFLTEEQAAGLQMDKQLMGEISAEAANYGAVIQESSKKAASGIYASTEELRRMRSIMSATIGFAALGFYVSEWGRIAQAIGNAAQALVGYDAIARQTAADAQKASDQALFAFSQLSAQENLNLSLMADAKERSRETLEAQIAATKARMDDIRKSEKALNDELDRRKQVKEQIEATTGAIGALEEKVLDLANRYEFSSTVGTQAAKTVKEISDRLKKLKDEGDQGAQTLNKLKAELNALSVSNDKAASSQVKFTEGLTSTRVVLPGLISDMDRLKQALLFPDMKEDQLLWNYAKLNAERIDQGLKPLQASFKQLGISMPNLTVPGVPAGMLNDQLNAVKQLTAAQIAMLPSERELQVAIEQLTKTYPQLTSAEIQNLALVRLQDPTFRQAIDNSSRMTRALHDQGIGWSQLSMQVRTAVSQMTGELTGWGGVASRVFDQMFNAVSKQIDIEQKQAGATQLSASLTAKATLDGLKQLAPVKAIMYTAEGFGHLAAFQYAQATEDFAAAALWGTVGAFQIASMAGAFNPGSGSGSAASAVATAAGSTSSSSGTAPALASGAASAAAAANGSSNQQTVIVQFQGPVYGGSAGVKELISKFNQAVKFNRQQLVASHTVTGKAL